MTDHVEADALVLSGQDVVQHLVVHAGIVAEVGVRAPSGVPPGVEQQEVRLRRLVPVGQQLRHGDGLALTQPAAVDDQRPAYELLRRKGVQRGTPGKQVGGRIHMGAGVGEHAQHRLLEAVLFIGVGGGQHRRLCAGIDGHPLPDGVGQVDHAHRSTLFLDDTAIVMHRRRRCQPAEPGCRGRNRIFCEQIWLPL